MRNSVIADIISAALTMFDPLSNYCLKFFHLEIIYLHYGNTGKLGTGIHPELLSLVGGLQV